MNEVSLDRRKFIRTAGLTTTAGLVGLAGCTGDAGDDDDDATYVPSEPNYRGWFEGVSNYKATVDARGQDAVQIDVGVQGNSGFYKFGPAAIAVTPDTPITWKWTGKGGTHNVVAEQGAFDSGKLVDEKGYTFEYTLEEPAIYKYVCEPHRSLGMKGAVFVSLEG